MQEGLWDSVVVVPMQNLPIPLPQAPWAHGPGNAFILNRARPSLRQFLPSSHTAERLRSI